MGVMQARVGPGTYQLRLSLGDAVSETTVTVLPNPHVTASPGDYEEQQAVLDKIASTLSAIHNAVSEMRSARSQLKAYDKLLKDNAAAKELLAMGDSLVTG